jgi:hypothetical protein
VHSVSAAAATGWWCVRETGQAGQQEEEAVERWGTATSQRRKERDIWRGAKLLCNKRACDAQPLLVVCREVP